MIRLAEGEHQLDRSIADALTGFVIAYENLALASLPYAFYLNVRVRGKWCSFRDCRPDYRRVWHLDHDIPACGHGRPQIA